MLEEHDISPRVVEYLLTPPDADTLDNLLNMLGLEPRALMRIKEAPYADNHLDDAGLSRAQLIQAMIDHPILIERPIVVKDAEAVIGRPPENVLQLI